MKKLFVSCPVVGRTIPDVCKSMTKMKKIAEAIFEEELEVIPHALVTETRENTLSDLVRHVQGLAEADYFIGVRGATGYNSCEIEAEIAHAYDIPRMFVFVEDILCENETIW